MNVILWDNVSVGHDLWPHNECRSQWPVFHGTLILFYILKAVWLMNIILWDNETLLHNLWPQNRCRPQWPIFHGLVILPYLEDYLNDDWWTWYFGITSQPDMTFGLKINVGHSDIHFMIQWFCPIFSRLFEWWPDYLNDDHHTLEYWVSMTTFNLK